MRHTILIGLVAVLVGGWAVAQEGPAPKLSADEAVMVQTVLSLQKIAQTACDQLAPVQEYTAATRRTTARIEANHPGMTMNWQTGALVAKDAK